MAKEADRLLADTGWLLEPLRTTDTGIDSANPETTPSQRNDSEQRAALTASQAFFVMAQLTVSEPAALKVRGPPERV
jgi:hypothetical protein